MLARLRGEVQQLKDDIKAFEYDDYRPVGRIVEPFFVKISVGDENFEVRFNQIEHNTMISQGEFSFPRVSVSTSIIASRA